MSLVEFALVVPICSLLILGGTEVARYVLLNQKLDRLATSVSDLIAQEDAVSAAELTNIFEAAPNLTWPFNVQTNGRIIVSSIGQVSGQTRVLWQRQCPGNGCSWSGTPTFTSRIGTQSGLATMPSGLTVSSTDNVIVAEVFYNFTPFFWRQDAGRDALSQRVYPAPPLKSHHDQLRRLGGARGAFVRTRTHLPRELARR